MDGLSVAASVIAVVDVSVKVITLCSQYSKAVANASADISRLETLLKGLKTTLDHAEALIKAPQGASLSTSQNLQEQLTACHSTLQKLHDKLDGGIARQTKHRLWTRALKWPFSRDEIDSMVSTLEHCHRRIMDGLLIDQTTLLLHIKSGVDGVSAMSLYWGFLLMNVSQYMTEKDDYDTALDVARQSAEIREELLGPNHYHTLNSLDRLAFTYGCQGRWVEAEKLQVRVMETSKTKLGADHLDTLRRARNMAITFWRQGRLEEAERLEVQLLEKFKTKLGTDHPDTLTSMSDIATTYFTQGRFEEAERLQVQLLEKMKTRLGADHPNTLTSMSDIAKTYFTQGRLEEAERLQVQLLEKFKTKLGAEHPDTLTSMSYLALIYWHQGRLKEAETLEVQVLGGRKAKLGANHPDTLIIMHNLALTLESLGRLHEALELMHSCVCLRQHILGQSHPDTKSSERAMAMWQQGTE
ncbi:hypothetical protein MY5147_006404 [Beauveria neobassiana]